MTRAAPLQRSFAGGEVTPRLFGRPDLVKYQTGVATMENFIALPQGPAARRPGMRFVRFAKHDEARVKLLPFVFSAEQSCAIELGDRYARWLRDVDVPAPAFSLSNGGFASGLTDWVDASSGGATIETDPVSGRATLGAAAGGPAVLRRQIEDVPGGTTTVLSFTASAGGAALRIGTAVGLDDLAGARLLGAGWHTCEIAPASTGDVWLEVRVEAGRPAAVVGPFATHPAGPLELPTPWAGEEARAVSWTQSADVIFVAHVARPPQRIARHGYFSWSIERFDAQDGPYLRENADAAHTISFAAASGLEVAATASRPTFRADDVDRPLRVRAAGKWSWARIAHVTSATEALVEIKRPLPATAATAAWRLGAWSEATGWPSAVAFHQQRLVWAATRQEPQTIWASQSALYDGHAPSERTETDDEDVVTDTCALAYTLASDRVDGIRWLAPLLQDLAIGAGGGEFRLTGGPDRTLTPLNAMVHADTAWGADPVAPARVGERLLFVQRGGRRLRELQIDVDRDGWIARDASIVAEHLGARGFVALAWAADPESVLWVAGADGSLMGLTMEAQHEVDGWHRHPTAGFVEDLAVTPDGEDGARVWLVVRRTLGGVERRCIETLEGRAGDGDRHLDCCVRFARDEASVDVEGLSHLAGCEVGVCADGASHRPLTVSPTGTLTLDAPAKVVVVGLPYASVLETLEPEAGAQDGTSIGKTKRAHRVALRSRGAAGFRIGPPGGPLVVAPSRSPGDPIGAAPPTSPHIVERRIELPPSYEAAARVRIEFDQPLPFVVVALAPRMAAFDGG